MIDAVVNGLDQHNDNRSLIGPIITKVQNLAQFPLLRHSDQLFSRPIRTSPQFIEARKWSGLVERSLRPLPSIPPSWSAPSWLSPTRRGASIQVDYFVVYLLMVPHSIKA